MAVLDKLYNAFMADESTGYDGAVNGIRIVHGIAIVAQSPGRFSQPVAALKLSVHRRLLDRVNLEALRGLSSVERARSEIRAVIAQLVDEESTLLNAVERAQVIEDLLDEVLGGRTEEPPLPLSPVARESVFDSAIRIIGNPEDAMRWLGTPVWALGNATPISKLYSAAGKDEVLAVLEQLEHGVL